MATKPLIRKEFRGIARQRTPLRHWRMLLWSIQRMISGNLSWCWTDSAHDVLGDYPGVTSSIESGDAYGFKGTTCYVLHLKLEGTPVRIVQRHSLEEAWVEFYGPLPAYLRGTLDD